MSQARFLLTFDGPLWHAARVLDGEVEVTLDNHTDVLKPGDCIYFDSKLRHRVECVEESGSRVLAIIHAPHK